MCINEGKIAVAKLAPYGQTDKSPFLNDLSSEEAPDAAPLKKKMIGMRRMKPILGKIHFSHASRVAFFHLFFCII